MRAASLPAVATALFLAAACSGTEEPVQEGPSAADSIMAAQAQYDPAGFDTISWETNDDAIVRGSVVFSYSCARCHGRYAEGDGEFVTRGDTLRPPDITVSDWRFLEDREGLREFIYTGSERGMPHWGLEGLKYRDVDAVATFLQEGLTRN